jgi:nitrate reductase alpha subunit
MSSVTWPEGQRACFSDWNEGWWDLSLGLSWEQIPKRFNKTSFFQLHTLIQSTIGSVCLF